MDTLWAASTVKVIGSDLDDVQFSGEVSRLVGEHDVASRVVHFDGGYGGRQFRKNITSALRHTPAEVAAESVATRYRASNRRDT